MNNKKHGQGQERYITNIKGKFVGYFFEDLKDGKGSLELENGYKYEG